MTAVPAALDALLATLRAATFPAGLADSVPSIYDGAWQIDPAEPDVITVGWVPEGKPGVVLRNTRSAMGQRLQTFDVLGLLWALSGDDTAKPARDRCDVLIEVLRATLLADKTLGGVVTDAFLTDLTWDQVDSVEGRGCSVEYTVAIRVITTP